MFSIQLTQNSTPIIGTVAKILGFLMEFIFNVLSSIGIPNIGLAIIIFTIVIYLCMMPLTIKQQKFSKLSAKMNPELQAVQAKYKNKKDNDSMMKMNEETKEVYAKYGTSPTGSCLQLLIQMPILFALYRVIDNIPAYVSSVKATFSPLVENIVSIINKTISYTNKDGEVISGSVMDFIKSLSGATHYTKQDFTQTNTIIDVLNKCSTADFNNIKVVLSDLAVNVEQTKVALENYNNFLGINIANSPSYYVTGYFSNLKAGDNPQFTLLLAIGAIMFPLLAALTQWFNVKLMPQAPATNNTNDTMASSMKTMNTMMPIMSAVFCFTLPTGMGLYWIAGAVIRSIQQVLINKHLDKTDINEIIKKNVEKANKKREKKGISAQMVTNNARLNTKTVEDSNITLSAEEKENLMKKATDYYDKGVKPGSLAAKANMVKQYNEKNNK